MISTILMWMLRALTMLIVLAMRLFRRMPTVMIVITIIINGHDDAGGHDDVGGHDDAGGQDDAGGHDDAGDYDDAGDQSYLCSPHLFPGQRLK